MEYTRAICDKIKIKLLKIMIFKRFLLLFAVEPAGDSSITDFHFRRLFLSADIHCSRTPWVESTARRRIN